MLRSLNEGIKPSTPKPIFEGALNNSIPRPDVPSPETYKVYTVPFAFGQKVHIDGHLDIKATVTGVAFYPHNSEVRVEWFANGDAKSAWIGVDRLTPAS